jgi:TorA maturation chaperone TorD
MSTKPDRVKREIDTLIETALARAALYNFLAAAFGDLPTPQLMTSAADILPGIVPMLLDDLGRAYTRLLVGPSQEYTPPYASVYLSPEFNGSRPQLWGQEAVAVEAIYQGAGLEIAPGQSRVPDHLALELQFMQHLCAREADAQAHGDAGEANIWRSRQHGFLRDHLWLWLPQFIARLSRTETHPFYRGLADFTLSFVQSEISSPEDAQLSEE